MPTRPRCISRSLATGFEALVTKHPLAFADHAAEFYLGSGGDPARAFELAKLEPGEPPDFAAHLSSGCECHRRGRSSAGSGSCARTARRHCWDRCSISEFGLVATPRRPEPNRQ